MTTVSIVWRLLAAFTLGLLFYAGLKLTVTLLPETRHPILLTVASFWARTLAVLLAMLYMIRDRWEYAVLCIAAFSLGRAAVLKLFTRGEAKPKCT